MAGNPTDITAAEEGVVVVDVEDVLAGRGGAQEIATGRVHDTLGLASRAGSVQQEERVLGVHGLGGNVVGVLLDLLMPPPIPALGPGDLSAGALEDQAVGDVGALLQRLIDNLLGANDLAAALALVGRDDNLGLGVDDAVAQGIGRKAGKHNGVDSANTRAGQKSDQGLGNHGKIDGNRVALLDAHLLESVGDLRHLAEQLAVCDGAAIALIVGLIDDGRLVGVLKRVAVHAVEAGVQAALREPRIVAVLEAAGVHRLEIALPRKQLAGHTAPELLGLLDRLLVQLLVVLEAIEMRLLVRVLTETSLSAFAPLHASLGGDQRCSRACLRHFLLAWRGHPAPARLVLPSPIVRRPRGSGCYSLVKRLGYVECVDFVRLVDDGHRRLDLAFRHDV